MNTIIYWIGQWWCRLTHFKNHQPHLNNLDGKIICSKCYRTHNR